MVSRISDDWTNYREASWEQSELKTAFGVYAPRANLSPFPTYFRISFGALSCLRNFENIFFSHAQNHRSRCIKSLLQTLYVHVFLKATCKQGIFINTLILT